MSFASLKKASAAGNSLAKLTKEIEKINQPQAASGPDDRLWKPELDKSGNGYAVIRFLPAPDGEDMPWAKIWSHAFKGPGGQWYIENSLTTIGKDDPVGEMNRQLWNSGSDRDKEVARAQKRKLSYYSNIYVVRDPANPQNEGKVMLYKYGKKIHDKILAAMQPEFEDEEPINPFDFWAGADFKLKIKKVAGYWNYDSSEFARPGTLGDFSDDELEAIWTKEYSLEEISAPAQFKTYDELKKRLDYVLGVTKPASRPVVDEEVADEEEEYKPVPQDLKAELNSLSSKSSDEDDDDALSYFQRLAEE